MRRGIWRGRFAVVAVVIGCSAALLAEELPGRPDGGSTLAVVGSKQLRLSDLRARAEASAEKARFERLEGVGRYRYEFFDAVIRQREAWLDAELLALDLAKGSKLPAALVKERIQGVDSLTREEFETREDYLGGLRSKYRCELDVPAFRVAVARPDAPKLGRPDAPVTITEFLDLRCRACAEMSASILRVAADYGDAVAIEDRHFALTPRGGEAFRLAEAALCAGVQGRYWEYRGAALSRIGDPRPIEDLALGLAADAQLSVAALQACLAEGRMAAHVVRDQEEGAQAGVWGTPTVFVNGRRYLGGGEAKIREIVELELNASKMNDGCP